MINPNKHTFYAQHNVEKLVIDRYREIGQVGDFLRHVKRNLFQQLGAELCNNFETKCIDGLDFVTEFRVELCVFTIEQLKELIEQEYLRGRKDTQVAMAQSIVAIQRESLL